MILVKDRLTGELYGAHRVDAEGYTRDNYVLQRFSADRSVPLPNMYLVDLRDQVVEMSKKQIQETYEVL